MLAMINQRERSQRYGSIKRQLFDCLTNRDHQLWAIAFICLEGLTSVVKFHSTAEFIQVDWGVTGRVVYKESEMEERCNRPKLTCKLACLISCFVSFLWAHNSSGYSLLTHEQIVDMAWKEDIVPLLLRRFPGATEDQLRHAQAFAYGGCLVQDLGYYPFGNKFFSDLAHYVRSGDFVLNLIDESADLNQYAFALGALAHYCSDTVGHPSVNRAVALTFPELRARHGDNITYEENPKAHIQTEFGFDITQVAKGRYTSDRYHDFIGFEVSKPLLERAFLRTYGLRVDQVLGAEDLAIGTFRHAVSQVIPEMTRAALTAYHPELVKEIPNFSEKKFLYNVSRTQFEAEWGREYRKPGPVARALGLLVRLVPKVGALKSLAFKMPSPKTEDLYIKSVNRALETYRAHLQQVGDRTIELPNLDFDTGHKATPGEYGLCDETYARLVHELVSRHYGDADPQLRANILTFYSEAQKLAPGTKPSKQWRRSLYEVKVLRAGPNSALAMKYRKHQQQRRARLQSPKARDA